MIRAIALAMTIFASTVSGQQAKSDALVHVPIVYERGMLVSVSEEGAGAIRFLKPFALGNENANGVVGVEYLWRYLPADSPDGQELTGQGKVFSKLTDGVATKDSAQIECGPITFRWQFADERTGLIEYNSEIARVHTLSESEFAGVPDAEHQQPPLDLSIFLHTIPENASNNNRIEDKRTMKVAPLVEYNGTATIVRHKSGVAIFEFGESFERVHSPTETHFGVQYQYTFVPTSGCNQTGKGEVYEQYKDKGYDGQGSRLVLRGGPIGITWSWGGEESGWLYCDLDEMLVWTCSTADKESLLRAISSSALGPRVSPPTHDVRE